MASVGKQRSVLCGIFERGKLGTRDILRILGYLTVSVNCRIIQTLVGHFWLEKH